MDLWDITGGELDPRKEVITWTSHAWTTETKDLIVTCSDEGHLLVIRPLTNECILCDRLYGCQVNKKGEYTPAHFVSVKTC